MNAVEDKHRRHLLTHAAAMGGWFSEGYAQGDYTPTMDGLVREGLFDRVHKDGRPCYELTPSGAALAAELDGAR